MPTATSPARPATRKRLSVPDGVITAVVAVTGVKDHVDDTIVPGAFTRTFALRRPKVVFHHDWLRFLGRSLHYVELMPGDKRLPKKTKDGKPWPKEAGAVVAVMQFNLNVEAGRDGYEWARFYTESDECEWSIGYKVVPGKASKGRDGVRYIYDLDVYEFSLVLFGAASLSMTLDVKSLEGHDGLDVKAVPFGAQLLDQVIGDFQRKALEVKSAEKMVGSGVMVALFPPADVAQDLAVADGSAAEDLHVTLAFLGDAEDLTMDPAELVEVLRPALAGQGVLSGEVGGLGQFPDTGDGAPTYIPVDVPGLSRLREDLVDAIGRSAAAEALRTNHGFTPHMTLGYDLADVTPAPSTPVTFDTVWLVVGEERIAMSLGTAALEGKAAAAAVAEAKRTFGTTGHSAFDAVREAKALVEGDKAPSGARPPTMPGAAKKIPSPAPRKAATAKKPAVRAKASGGGGSFDESKHKRAPKGATGGGQFTSKGAGYESTGRKGESETVTKTQRALIDGGFLGEKDGKDGRGDDGYFGDKTEKAVKSWQTEMGYEPTGKLNGEQLAELTGDGDDATGKRRKARKGREVTQDKDRQGRDRYLPNGEKNPAYGRATGVATVKGPRQRPMPTEPPRPPGAKIPVTGPSARRSQQRTERKSAWDTVAEAKTLQSGMETKYDTSSLAVPGNGTNWLEEIGGELPPFVRAVAHALERERGKTREEAIQIALGRIRTWATGGGDVTEKTRAKAVKTMASWDALRATARATPPKMEAKHMHEMPGSFESVRDQIRQAAQDLLCPPDKSQDPTNPGGISPAGAWIGVEATYPTYAIINHEHDGKTTTYQVPYTASGGEVSLGKPEEVTLKVVVEDTGAEADKDDEAMVRFAEPAVGMLDAATAMVMFGGAEGKSADVLRPAVLRLLDALAVKGMPDVLDDDVDDEDEPEGDPTDVEDTYDYTEPTGEPLPEQLVDEPAEDELEDELEEKVLLDVDEVARQLEALRA